MARERQKKKEQTVEERLAQALVPVEEQPYEAPENWGWVKLGNITEVIGGGTPSSSIKVYYEGGTIAWITPADLSGYKNIYISSGEKKITKLGLEKSSAKLLPPNTVCLSSRAPIGYVVIAQNELCTNQGFKNFLPSKCYIPRYLYWYLKGNKELLQSYASGTTFLELSGSKAATIPFPLPPLAEQQRIVDRIESLFAKLDEAKEKAQDVVDGFEARKAAILHKAFTGELTNYWCIEHGVDRKRWITKNLGDITINHDSQRIPLSRGERNDLAPLFDYYGASGIIDRVDRFIFEGRFLLIGEDGANLVTRSKPIAFIAEGQFWVNNHAHVLDTTDAISMDFLCYYINSIDLTSYITGSAQPKMTQAKMNSISVPVPAIDEQVEIVRILDTLFAKEQQAKEMAEAVLDQIEAMKKSILAHAFRGELGTNDPTEESAVELLKQVL